MAVTAVNWGGEELGLSYCKGHWHHDGPDEPVVLYSEIDSQCCEMRKVEEYADARIEHADAARETGAA